MAFGKRTAGLLAAEQVESGQILSQNLLSQNPGHFQARGSASSASNVPMTHPVFAERIPLLLADMTGLMSQARTIADTVRNDRSIETAQLHLAGDPAAYPLDIARLSRHFNFQRGGKLRHGVYCYFLPGNVLDRKAQLHMLELTTAVMSFNNLCIAAHEDGALSIALQSTAARDSLDKTTVLSAWFAALLQNLLYQQSAFTGPGGPPAKGLDTARMKACINEWMNRAKGAMLAKDQLSQHIPDMAWPIILAETEIDDHQGQVVVNQVYLPSDLAAPVMAKMAAVQMAPRRLAV